MLSDNGEKNLNALLSSLDPYLDPTSYVFHFCPDSNYGDSSALEPLATFREEEGLTFVLDQSVADIHALEYSHVFKRITLRVHSSLSAVGLTAAVSHALTLEQISANIIAAFFHDHVFVPVERADDAMAVLVRLANTTVTKVEKTAE